MKTETASQDQALPKPLIHMKTETASQDMFVMRKQYKSSDQERA